MNILFTTHFVYDLWFLRHREYPYSGTVRIRLLSHIYYYSKQSVPHPNVSNIIFYLPLNRVIHSSIRTTYYTYIFETTPGDPYI